MALAVTSSGTAAFTFGSAGSFVITGSGAVGTVSVEILPAQTFGGVQTFGSLLPGLAVASVRDQWVNPTLAAPGSVQNAAGFAVVAGTPLAKSAGWPTLLKLTDPAGSSVLTLLTQTA